MAQNIKGDAAAPKPKRGRPSKAEKAAAEARATAAAAAPPAPSPPGNKHNGPPKASPGPSAPAFGANRITARPFLQHVAKLRGLDEQIAKAKLVVKGLNGQKKDARNLAKADGIVLGELDEALEALETDRVDLLAREERRCLYYEFLGLPTLRSAETAKIEKLPAKRWGALGEVDGRLGKIRAVPEGCPAEHVQDYLHGWDKGQRVLMGESKLTKGAFKGGEDPHAAGVAARDEGAGGAGAAPETPPAGAPEVQPPADNAGVILVLKVEDFTTGTALDDANKKTVLPELVERWEAAERVVAVFEGKKRVLKEPDPDVEGGVYEDTGEPDVAVTDAQDATPEDLAAVEPAVEEVVDSTTAAGDALAAGEEPTGQDEAETFH